MDIKETFNQLDNTKFNDFNNRLEGLRNFLKTNIILPIPKILAQSLAFW